jgi:hypothetical protein
MSTAIGVCRPLKYELRNPVMILEYMNSANCALYNDPIPASVAQLSYNDPIPASVAQLELKLSFFKHLYSILLITDWIITI